MKSRIPSRTALIVIGASGPIAGFCIAVPAACYGLLHSKVAVGQIPPPTPPILFWLLFASRSFFSAEPSSPASETA
jgi:hypothetical protein